MLVSDIRKIPSGNDEIIAASEELGSVITPSEENRYLMIAEAAYYRALSRGLEGGDANEDWYAAEAEIDESMANKE